MTAEKRDVSTVLISEEQIAAKVREIGEEIGRDYAGEAVLLVGILKGSVAFLADLMRAIPLEDVSIDFMSVSSYGSSTKTSGVVKINKDIDSDIRGRNVIIVEDIIDTGLTLKYLKEYLCKRSPKTLKIAAIFDKPSRRELEIEGDYVGFKVDDLFIVGYGLDADQKYRNLPYISWIKTE